MMIDTYESILLVVTAKEDKGDQLFGKLRGINCLANFPKYFINFHTRHYSIKIT